MQALPGRVRVGLGGASHVPRRSGRLGTAPVDIRGAAAIVSGGASGLGAGAARALASVGAVVTVADLDAEKGEALAGEIGGAFVRCDVTDETQVLAAVEAASGRGPLRVAVSCAGIGPAGRIVARDGSPHSLDVYRRAIEVNQVGTFNLLRLAAASIAKLDPVDGDGQRGVVVNTASIAGFEGQVGQIAYASSKGAVIGMTITAARDLAQLGIRVCSVAPGTMDTPMLAGLSAEAIAGLADQVVFPKRLGRPDEFGTLVRMIVELDYLNGETIRFDGALRMPPR
jgi:NAD(P)-dependent dehydrogenase (short-subunit alcohol dehydrogenase family)